MQARPSWIHGPGQDIAVALCWVPFALTVHAVEANPSLLATALSATLLLSLSHQPVTLALVYGDREQFRVHRRLFTWTPVIALAVVVAGLHVSFVAVAVVAAMWNAEHTLMQRFGLTRMYGRKAGDDHGAMERLMLLAWLGATVVIVAANRSTPHLLDKVNLGAVNQRGAAMVASLRPQASLLLPLAVGVAVISSGRWALAEHRRGAAVNPAKYLYLAGTAALLLVICVDPIAGLAAFVGAHALEYFSVVNVAVRRRSADGGAGLVGRVVRSPVGRPGFFAVSVAGVVVPMTLLSRVWSFTPATAMYLTVGALHIFYDGYIWKLRRPSVARDLSIVPTLPARGGAAPLAV